MDYLTYAFAVTLFAVVAWLAFGWLRTSLATLRPSNLLTMAGKIGWHAGNILSLLLVIIAVYSLLHIGEWIYTLHTGIFG